MNMHKENPFKKLEAERELPENLKEKVMNSIGIAEMLSGFTELFTVNLAETAVKMIPTEEFDPKARKKKRKKNGGKGDPDVAS